jgi:uncharacterized radical SAM superfamily Fe-S cluster-containing enzyme
VPSEFQFRDNQVWIRKTCPTCGDTEALVSTDAKVWQAKRDLFKYVDNDPVACTLNCDKCKVDHKPNMVFIDVTNRCNMNCPICIATIRGMGFDFNPPLAYFEKLFAEVGKMKPSPMIQLFGGEPTVRNDLLEIIKIGRKNGLKMTVTTNGVRLADEEYCKEMCEARVPMRFAFDGRSADIYQTLRNAGWAYEKKMKALDNLKKFSKRKHTIIGCAAYGVNDHLIGDMFQYVHDNRDLISDIGLIPLTENWEPGTFSAAKTTTMEDVEKMVKDAVAPGEVEFIPGGLTYSLKQIRSFFRSNPRSEMLLLAGVHPNCESVTLLVSDGQKYRGINYYLKKSFSQAAVEFATLAKKLAPRLDRLDRDKFLQRMHGRAIIIKAVTGWMFGTVNFHHVFGGNPVIKGLGMAFAGLFNRVLKTSGVPHRRKARRMLRVAMLPFEEQHSVDAARMESCKAVFAYEDADDGKVKTIPACLWYPYRNAILEKLSGKYGVVNAPRTKVESAELAGLAAIANKGE